MKLKRSGAQINCDSPVAAHNLLVYAAMGMLQVVQAELIELRREIHERRNGPRPFLDLRKRATPTASP